MDAHSKSVVIQRGNTLDTQLASQEVKAYVRIISVRLTLIGGNADDTTLQSTTVQEKAL